MKTRKVTAYWAVLIFLMAALLLAVSGCASSGGGETEGTADGLSESSAETKTAETIGASSPETQAASLQDLDAQIKIAYQEKYPSGDRDISVEDLTVSYVAEFDGAYAVYVGGWFTYTEALCCDTVNGLKFWYPTSWKMLIYWEGTLYDLPDAFAEDALDAEDLQALYQIHRESHTSLYGELAEK